MAAVMHSPDP